MTLENKNHFFNLEIKQEALTEEGTFEGYASIFGNEDLYGDIIEKGAFAKSLKKRTVKLFWQHQSDNIIGEFTEIKEDDKGLYVKGRLFLKIPKAQIAYELLKQKAIDGISIGYRTIKSRFNDKKENIRYLEEVDLFEASIVTFPANEQATITDVKAKKPEEKKEIKLEDVKTLRDIEDYLKSYGLTNKKSKAIVSKISALRDEGDKKEDTTQKIVDELKNLANYYSGN